jgi:intracellular sulfur oxidation DsrE/DsrF family protein
MTAAIRSALTLAAALTAAAAAAQEPARVAIHVDEENVSTMNMALNNAANIIAHYESVGRPVQVEIVAYGPGLHMLREDTSPVKDRIAVMSLEHEGLAFSACLNTVQNMQQKEQVDVPLVSEAVITPSGAVRLMELQEAGWTYLRP